MYCSTETSTDKLINQLATVVTERQKLLETLKAEFTREHCEEITALKSEFKTQEKVWKEDVKILQEQLHNAIDSLAEYKENAFRLVDQLETLRAENAELQANFLTLRAENTKL